MASVPSSTDQRADLPIRPEKTDIRWGAIVFCILAIGSFAAAGCFGGLAQHAGINALQSTAFKVFMIAGGIMVTLGGIFALISQTHNKASNLTTGILRSRFFAPFALAGLAVAGLFMVSALGHMHLPDWAFGAAAAGGFALGILAPLPFKGKQKLEFEASALLRLSQKNYDEIATHHGKKIFLGALPNSLTHDGKHLKEQEGVGAVLSVNEPWERTPRDLSLPYSPDYWREAGIDYKEMDVFDHELLTNENLDEAANWIAEEIDAGRNVYVHCRAGKGRSAMAVAAYLIKYGYFLRLDPTEEACQAIEKGRPISTIRKKFDALKAFERYCQGPQPSGGR